MVRRFPRGQQAGATGEEAAEGRKCEGGAVGGAGRESVHRVTRVLDAIVAERGQPLAIRCDNGPELTSRHFLAWCVERQIELVPIQPGKPTQKAHVESFHGRLREKCLNVS